MPTSCGYKITRMMLRRTTHAPNLIAYIFFLPKIVFFLEQEIVVKSHKKFGKTASFEMFKVFQNGRESVEDCARPGRTSTSNRNTEKMVNLIWSDGPLTICVVVKTVGIDEEWVRQISHNGLRSRLCIASQNVSSQV